MQIWFISDWHFNHDKDFIWKARGYDSVENMNQDQIAKHNSLVAEDDIVYVLGDCIMGDLEAGIAILKQLNGKKYLAFGNHDTEARIKAYIDNNFFEDIQLGYRIKKGKYSFILSHYPQLVANGSDKAKVYSIHGHTHSPNAFSDVCHAYNVNIDAHNGYPVSIDDIIKEIKENENNVKVEV